MQITKITVSSTRKLPHPNADFASISGHVSLEAELIDRDDVDAVANRLQAQADRYVDKHMDAILDRLRMRSVANKSQSATEASAASLAVKHGGGKPCDR